jgi:hypothetical protein
MATEQKTKKDAFLERFAGRYPDVDMNNEDAYYDQAGRMMDEYEGFEKRAGILKENISKSPLLQDLVLASQEAENFDPIVWLAENRGLDLKALTEDGEYVKKLAEAGQKHIDAVSKGDEIKKQRETNLPGSIKACMDAAKGAGISDEEAQNTIGMMFDIMDDLIIGKINPQVFLQLAKGGNYDTAVEDAKAEGMQQGLETNVKDKLRKMPAVPTTQMGSQAPVKEPKAMPKPKKRNPFVDD